MELYKDRIWKWKWCRVLILYIYIYFIYLVSELVSLHPNLFHIDIFRIFSSTRQMGEPRRTTEQCSVRK